MNSKSTTVIKITAEKTKFDFCNEQIAVASIEGNYSIISNRVYDYIHQQLEQLRKTEQTKGNYSVEPRSNFNI